MVPSYIRLAAANFTVVSTADDQTACSPTCSCRTCVVGNFYAPLPDHTSFEPVIMTAEPEPITERYRSLPQMRSDRMPVWALPVRRTGFNRPGRTLRHRGGFRNFHKMARA